MDRAILTVGGVAATGAVVFDMSTGRANFGDVVRDIALFIEGWSTELFLDGFYDAELEKTHAYALFVLLGPGLLLFWYNLIPFVKRVTEFRIEPDGSVALHAGAAWAVLVEYEYSAVTADGTTITFSSPHGGSSGSGAPCAASVHPRVRRSTACLDERGVLPPPSG